MAYGAFPSAFEELIYPSARSHALSIQIFAGCVHAILHHLVPTAAIPLHSFRLHPVLSRKRRMPFGCSLSTEFLFVRTGFPLELPFPRFVTAPQLLRARPHGHSPRWGKHYRVWLISLTAVGCFVLQVWDSASSRLLADLHRGAHIASVVPKKAQQVSYLTAPLLLAEQKLSTLSAGNLLLHLGNTGRVACPRTRDGCPEDGSQDDAKHQREHRTNLGKCIHFHRKVNYSVTSFIAQFVHASR